MVLVPAVTGQNLASPLIRTLPHHLCSPHQHCITAFSGGVLAGCVTAILDGALHLWDLDVMQLFEGVWVQSSGWAHILKPVLSDQSEKEQNILPLKIKSGRWRGV